MAKNKYDEVVNHPAHYTFAPGAEVIDIIELWKLDYHCGNSIKYIARAGKKHKLTEIQDLKKAVWYLNRKIKLLEKKQHAKAKHKGA